MRLLSATQNGVVRYDHNTTGEHFQGLHTSDLQTCWAIIIFNKTTQRASLLHKTFKMDPQSILAEFDWVGRDGAKWHIAHNTFGSRFDKDFDSDLAMLLAEFNRENISRPDETKLRRSLKASVIFNCQTWTIIEGSPSNATIQRAANYRERQTINLINDWFLPHDPSVMLPADLQHDGSNWTAMPNIIHDLSTLDPDYCEKFSAAVAELDHKIYLSNAIKEKGNEHYRAGRFDKASNTYKLAIMVHYENANAWFNLGQVTEKSGDTDRARLCWQEALTIKPDYTKARRKLQITAPDVATPTSANTAGTFAAPRGDTQNGNNTGGAASTRSAGLSRGGGD